MRRALARRDLLKLGAGVVLTATAADRAESQEGESGPRRPAPPSGSARPPGELRPHTGAGYRNDAGRLGGNGPMDDTTRKIVTFVREFSAANLTPSIIDAVTGQNGLEQARQFMKVADVTGIVLTKLDGTAKGGIAVAISKELNLPIRYVGIGEQVNDLMVFDAESYVNGLFN